MRAHIILHERGEQSLGYAKADGARGKIHVIRVLGARGITLRPLVAAEIFHFFPCLLAEEILDGMKDRGSVRLHRDAVLGAEDIEIKRGHDGRE